MKTYSRKKSDDQEEVILDLNELCRLCMSKEDQLVSIFENDDQVPLTLRIMACVSLEVVEGDGLPNKICHPCKYQLEKSYTFRKKCEGSDTKLRQHMRSLEQKFPELGVEMKESAPIIKVDQENIKMQEDAEDLTGEAELAGVAQVAYIAPESEPEAHDNITLPADDEVVQEDKTKFKKSEVEGNNYYVVEGGEGVAEIQHDESQPMMEDQELDFIAEAVKSTLASHPDLNLTGDLQMKVEQEPGKPTQVSVTTDDGSVIVLELMSDEQDNPLEASPQDEDDDINDEGELKVFQCPSCPKSFARRIQLRRHSSVHMQQRGFSCGICEKWFPTRSALIRHERIHTGERPFQCEMCQKSFAQKEILFRHMMTHTGVKPYNCPHCYKGFTQKEPLKAHLKSHVGSSTVDVLQLHYCTLCPKVFCHASGLSRHLVTHTGKTFKCRDCDKSFNDKSSLRRHIRQCGHQE